MVVADRSLYSLFAPYLTSPHLPVQVVFSDHTEIILSREARVVTYVDKEGNRETLLLQRVLEEQR